MPWQMKGEMATMRQQGYLAQARAWRAWREMRRLARATKHAQSEAARSPLGVTWGEASEIVGARRVCSSIAAARRRPDLVWN
jgi:hypothetical protein